MAKKIKFNRTDAPLPKVTSDGLLALRAPFAFAIQPRSYHKIDLGVSCEKALILVPVDRIEIAHDVLGASTHQSPIYPANKQISVVLRNSTDEAQFFEVGDMIVKAYVLDMGNVVVE